MYKSWMLCRWWCLWTNQEEDIFNNVHQHGSILTGITLNLTDLLPPTKEGEDKQGRDKQGRDWWKAKVNWLIHYHYLINKYYVSYTLYNWIYSWISKHAVIGARLAVIIIIVSLLADSSSSRSESDTWPHFPSCGYTYCFINADKYFIACLFWWNGFTQLSYLHTRSIEPGAFEAEDHNY